MYDYLFLREQRGAEDLKRLVLAPWGVISPRSRRPPSTLNIAMFDLFERMGRRTLRQTPLRISRNISHYFTNIVKTVRRAKFVRAVGVYFLFHNEGCKRSGSRIYANLPESYSVFSYKYTE